MAKKAVKSRNTLLREVESKIKSTLQDVPELKAMGEEGYLDFVKEVLESIIEITDMRLNEIREEQDNPEDE